MHQYTVSGRTAFPFDMLRHDQAWPADQTAWMAMVHSHLSGRHIDGGQPPVSVKLNGNLPPTADRWASFGWGVRPCADQTVRSEDAPAYDPRAALAGWAAGTDDETIINEATRRLATRLHTGPLMQNPADTRRYLRLMLGGEEREVFGCLLLDTRHRVISFERLFFGTIDSAAVHPREIVKRALACNAAAVVLAHNHPSGVPEPGRADAALTTRVKDALALVDVQMLDHIIVGQADDLSMAEKGML